MGVYTELGNIQIFFGQVVDIEDPQQSCRCRVAIQGKTDQIEKEKLPWYFAWNGISSLPQLNDEVSVMIFDGNFATGFYGSKLVSDSVQTAINYRDYVEVFKKMTCDSDSSITYSHTGGLNIQNKNNGLTAGLANVKMFCGENSLNMTENMISLGTENTEAMLMGDKTVTYLNDIIKSIGDIVEIMYGGFEKIMTAAMPNPYTTAIGAKLMPFNLQKMTILTQLKILAAKSLTLQSKKTFNS